jgi:hypothetical protein
MKAILIALLAAASAAAQSVTVNITWPASGGAVTGFLVQRSTSAAGPFVQIGSVVAPAACQSITGTQSCTAVYTDISGAGNVLTVGAVYNYEVIGTNQFGNGPPSNPSAVTIPAPPGNTPPTGIPTIGTIVIP